MLTKPPIRRCFTPRVCWPPLRPLRKGPPTMTSAASWPRNFGDGEINWNLWPMTNDTWRLYIMISYIVDIYECMIHDTTFWPAVSNMDHVGSETWLQRPSITSMSFSLSLSKATAYNNLSWILAPFFSSCCCPPGIAAPIFQGFFGCWISWICVYKKKKHLE